RNWRPAIDSTRNRIRCSELRCISQTSGDARATSGKYKLPRFHDSLTHWRIRIHTKGVASSRVGGECRWILLQKCRSRQESAVVHLNDAAALSVRRQCAFQHQIQGYARKRNRHPRDAVKRSVYRIPSRKGRRKTHHPAAVIHFEFGVADPASSIGNKRTG